MTDNDSFIIHDGELISPDELPSTVHQRPQREKIPLQRLVIQIGSRVCDVTPVPGLSLITPKAFLTTSCEDDLRAYQEWLIEKGYAKTSIKTRIMDLKLWSRLLDGKTLCRTVIWEILNKYTGYTKKRLMYSLSRYGYFRRDKGDPSILMLIEIADIKIKQLAVYKKRKYRKWTEQERLMLSSTAELLCRAGDKTGIYLSLLMLGVPLHVIAFNELEISGNTVTWFYRRKQFSGQMPGFLTDALNRISWQPASKSLIYQSVRGYGYMLYDLNRCGIAERIRNGKKIEIRIIDSDDTDNTDN